MCPKRAPPEGKVSKKGKTVRVRPNTDDLGVGLDLAHQSRRFIARPLPFRQIPTFTIVVELSQRGPRLC